MTTTLSRSQLEHFEREGYVVVRGAFDPDRWIAPVMREYETVLDRLAEHLLAAGRISRLYDHLPFFDRFVEICAESNETNAQFFDFSLPQVGIRHDTPMWHGPAVFDMLRCPDLLDLVEGFIGPEIFSNPVQHVRIKAPESREARDPETGALKMGATNWHQDNGVVLPNADDTQILTVWFPLRHAGVEHGCLQVVPGSHRRGLMAHCPAGPGGLEVPEHIGPPRRRHRAADGPRRRGVHQQAHAAQLAAEPERRGPDQLRPALQPDRPADRPRRLPRLRRPQPPRPRLRAARRGCVGTVVGGRGRELADIGNDLPFNRWSADAPACA